MYLFLVIMGSISRDTSRKSKMAGAAKKILLLLPFSAWGKAQASPAFFNSSPDFIAISVLLRLLLSFFIPDMP